MHAIKGGWIGQTFALAKCNDSGGRKSRIRRSKEERKAMVESFIKKYQNSNNGTFPSLNLTHKEVGGSFYTVREIVREIIQENRVLGPAKLTPDEDDTNRFFKQYPLASISIEPQTANGIHLGQDRQGTSVTQVLNTSGQCTEAEYQRSCNGLNITGSKADERIEDCNELIYKELQVSDATEADKNVVEKLEASTAIGSHTRPGIIVETFPLRPVAKPTYSLDGSSDEARDLPEALEYVETGKLELVPANLSSVLDTSSLENCCDLLDENATANPSGKSFERIGDEKASDFFTTKEGIGHDIQDGTDFEVEVSRNAISPLEILEQSNLSLENSSDLVNENATIYRFEDEKAMPNLGDPLLKSSNFSTAKDGTVHDIQNTDLEVKPMVAPNSTHTNISGISNSQDEVVTENKDDVQHSSSSQEGNNPNPTLDRIKLESWEKPSKTSEEQETNPLMTFCKALVAAFVKFWSE